MGKVQKKLGRLHEALASFNQALDLDPKSGNMIKAHIDRLQVYLSMLACSAHPHIYSAHQPSKPGMHPRAIKACTCAVAQLVMVQGRGIQIGAGQMRKQQLTGCDGADVGSQRRRFHALIQFIRELLAARMCAAAR